MGKHVKNIVNQASSSLVYIMNKKIYHRISSSFLFIFHQFMINQGTCFGKVSLLLFIFLKIERNLFIYLENLHDIIDCTSLFILVQHIKTKILNENKKKWNLLNKTYVVFFMLNPFSAFIWVFFFFFPCYKNVIQKI